MDIRQKLIDIKNVTFEYFRRDAEGNVAEMVEALQNVSLQVEAGQFIAILGRNGSGKSTLAKHINALLFPSEGEVIVDGMSTEEEENHLAIRQTAGMVFQNPDNQIVGNLVEEDIAFGPENLGVPTADIWNRVNTSLCETGMESFRNQSPNHLSGGQKQRVAIAGVLAMHPKCIIFDEATAMLDPQGRKNMIAVAKRLQEENGITVILITHHMDEVLAADRVFVMRSGQVAAQGTPAQIFAQKQLLEDCGLCLPVFYQYMEQLRNLGILNERMCRQIHNEQELIDCLEVTYAQKRQDIRLSDEKEQMNAMQEDQTSYEPKKGILLNHVSYIYNQGYADERKALDDVSVHINQGEFVAVIGHTGSGKSTLMQHLNGLYLPTEGNVYYNGQDITDSDFSLKELRQKVGLVFQYPEYQLFAETVEKDVCFGPENMNISRVEAQKRAYEAIEAVGLPDTIYDSSPLQLSGGQKRRVAMAGILAMQPEYLVLDEPTAGLDPYSAKAILQMLKDLQQKQGIGIVLVSHSMEEVAEYADRIIVMDQGRKCMDGPVWAVYNQLYQLEELGLSVPVGNRILVALQRMGYSVHTQINRMEDIFAELARWKSLIGEQV
ncbi:MAG: energy-coupling factor transporter ATPase [Lachnospiraceae bacterium]|nr:energy-coupling factor transporter ATPase [Lachnospiraceae bacterium]